MRGSASPRIVDSPAGASQLRRRGITFHYVHAYKTRLLQILVPHGTELQHSVQELYDAHVIVLRHQLGLSREAVRSMMLDELRHLGDLLEQDGFAAPFTRLVDTSWMTQQGLLRRHHLFGQRLATTPFPPPP